MASIELQRTIQEYDNYIKKNGIDETIYKDYYYPAMEVAFLGEEDIPYALKVSENAKKYMEQIISQSTGGADFNWLEMRMQENKTQYEPIVQYYEILKLEAPNLLDSYMLYVEKNRPKRERFYEPRRRALLPVTNKIQELEDDKLDELFIHMPPRVGKLLADDTPVFTSHGWKKHGELSVGDLLVGSDGNYTEVTHVHPKNVANYKVTLSNGEEIYCHGNHEWTVYDRSCQRKHTYETWKMSNRLKRTEIKRGKKIERNNLYLPIRSPLKGQKKELHIHPYALGTWLGDGTKKHIPLDYLTSSIEQRLELLAGLIDTGGSLQKKDHRYQFSTTSERLKNDVVTLINTFGWRPSIARRKPCVPSSGIVGKKGCYVIGFNPTMEIPCQLERKKLNSFSKQRRIAIEKIERCEERTGNCITVSNADGLYAVGKTMQLTHNSQEITMATSWHCARDTEKSNLYVTYKEGLGGAFIVGVNEIWTDPTYCFADVFPNIHIADTDAKNHKIDLGRKKKYKTLSGKGLESGLNGEYDAYGWMILDDVLEGIQDVLNVDTLHRKQIIFDNNVMSRAKEQCKIIHNGTIWSLHDLYSDRLDFLQNNPQAKDIRYDIIKIPALDEKDESNFDYDYSVGFSTQSFLIKRAKFEENDDMASWLAQYQQEPIERDGAVFNSEHMKFYNGILPNEEPYRICAACDVALGGEDYLAFAVAYMYEDGSVYIHDVVFDNAEKKYTKPKVAKMFAKHNIGSAYFEANQGGEGYKDEIDEILKNEYGMKVNLVSEYAPSNKRKEQRIWDKAGSIRDWYFLDAGYRSPEYRKFMTNVYSFTIAGKNKHEDAPDCLASLAYFIEGSWASATAQAIQNPFRRGGYGYYGFSR
jgi:predicted phage terminase large subunit-like protein